MTNQTIKFAALCQLVLLVLVAGCAALLWPEHAGGVLSGAIVMTVNFSVLWFLMRRLQAGLGSKALYSMLFLLKIGAVFGVIAILILQVRVSGIGLAAGMMTTVLGLGLAVAFSQLSRTGDSAPNARV